MTTDFADASFGQTQIYSVKTVRVRKGSVTCSRLLAKNVEQRSGTWLKLLTKTLSKSL